MLQKTGAGKIVSHIALGNDGTVKEASINKKSGKKTPGLPATAVINKTQTDETKK